MRSRRLADVCHIFCTCSSLHADLFSVQGALEWLETNQDKSMEEITQSNETDATVEPPELKEGEVAKSMKCDDCGKKFRSMTQAEFHAEKTYVLEVAMDLDTC